LSKPITAKELANLLDLHADSLRLFARQWSNSPDDCVQEAFVALATQKQSPESQLGWLYQVVRRRAINDLRGSVRRFDREQSVARPDVSESNPITNLELVEEQQQLQPGLDSLPPDSRELIVLRIWSGLKWREIGDIIGCSSSAAQRRYTTALELMKQKLDKRCLTKRN